VSRAGTTTEPEYYARLRDAELRSGRWSTFVNGSFTVLVATLAVEGGWMQGGSTLPGFDSTGNPFNPERGTVFGSVGARIAF
jgi:hypothetical protein